MNQPGQVAPAAERRSAIADAVSRAGDTTEFVPSPQGYFEVPVVEVPAQLLVYRIENGRILSELTDEATKQNVTLEELEERSERIETQRLLHRMLLDKARDPAAPIFEELERYGRQTEPLLIQRDGVVLNGNRRLAAMRELCEQNRERFGQLEAARVAVLPDGLEREQLEVIEAALQMAPNLKLEYGWVNRRLKLRQHARTIDREKIVEAYRFRDVADIDRELGELKLAENYLDWIERPREFALVEDREKHFVKMHENVGPLKPDHLRDVWTLFGFAMLKAERVIDGNILHYFPFTDPVPPMLRHWVPRTLAEDRSLTARQDEGDNSPFDRELAARLRPLIDDPHRSEDTAAAVVALCDILKTQETRLVGFSRVLALLRKAHESLEQVDVDKLSAAQLRKVRAQIAALSAQVGTFSRGPTASRDSADRKRDLREVLHHAKRILRW